MPSPTLLRTLRELATMCIGREFIVVSSSELAKPLGLSQQAASRHLVELSRIRLIRRELDGRKQRVSITDKGYRALEAEFEAFARIFEAAGSVELAGRVVSGVGEGGYYLAQEGYAEQFERILGWKPYEGTLNLELAESARDMGLTPLRGERVAGFTRRGRTFGGATVYRGFAGSTPVALVIPDRGGYGRIAEFISPYHLRRTLKLKDGDTLKVHLVRG